MIPQGMHAPGLEKLSKVCAFCFRLIIIDGQQRITTAYMLIAVVKSILEEITHESQQV